MLFCRWRLKPCQHLTHPHVSRLLQPKGKPLPARPSFLPARPSFLPARTNFLPARLWNSVSVPRSRRASCSGPSVRSAWYSASRGSAVNWTGSICSGSASSPSSPTSPPGSTRRGPRKTGRSRFASAAPESQFPRSSAARFPGMRSKRSSPVHTRAQRRCMWLSPSPRRTGWSSRADGPSSGWERACNTISPRWKASRMTCWARSEGMRPAG